MKQTYRILVQRMTTDGKWKRVISTQGPAESPLEALVLAAEHKGRAPAGSEKNVKMPNFLDANGPVRYPNVHVELNGTSGNVFSLIGRTRTALRLAKIAPGEITKFTSECGQRESGLQKSNMTYDAVREVVTRWVKVA